MTNFNRPINVIHNPDLDNRQIADFWYDLYKIPCYSNTSLATAKLVGYSSLYHFKSPLMGNILVTCPFFGYGGFLTETNTVRDLLLANIDTLARKLRVDYVELRLQEQLPPPYSFHTDFNEFTLSLAASAEETWQDCLSSNARQNVRKAQRNGMVFTLTHNYKPVFRLLSRTLRNHGTPFHAERFFRLLIKYFGENVLFSQVHYKKRLVAGGIMLRLGEKIITPYIGSLQKFRHLGSNYCQYWGIIEHCQSNGIKYFELGRSPVDSVHDKFKRKWGATAIPVYYNYRVFNPAKKYRSVSQPSRYQLLATEIWQRLPLLATRLIGPHLFRQIP